jgi:transcriptional antiterminator RfaH
LKAAKDNFFKEENIKLVSMEKWYVAHSKPRNEELLWKQFCLRNFESYYPCITVQTMNLCARKLHPYFPGYLFVRADLEITGRSCLEWIPGGAGLVSFGDEPASVPDSLIFSIKQRLEQLETAAKEGPAALCKGDNIIVHKGVFCGYEGIFDIHLSGMDRARVLLSLLGNRQIPVEISMDCICRSDQH